MKLFDHPIHKTERQQNSLMLEFRALDLSGIFQFCKSLKISSYRVLYAEGVRVRYTNRWFVMQKQT